MQFAAFACAALLEQGRKLQALSLVLTGSFKTTPELFASPFGLPDSLSLDNYRTVVNAEGIGKAFINSLTVTIPATMPRVW